MPLSSNEEYFLEENSSLLSHYNKPTDKPTND